MTANLIEIVSDTIDVPANDLTLESGPLNQPEWDSLAHVTIVAAVEEAFGVSLEMREILGIKSISDLETVINRHLVQDQS